MFLLLLGAGTIYMAMGNAHEAMILLGFVVVIMLITVLQERRTDNALSALRDLSSPRAQVIRSGVTSRIAGTEIVRDDLILVVEGDRIPADGTLLEAHELSTNESMLSGESEPVNKQTLDLLFAGTLVISGQGLMRVTGIGRQTEMGNIGQSLDTIAIQASPLQEEMARLTKRLVWIALALCALLMGLFWALRGDWLGAVLSGITLAMGVLPQELPVIMIVFFAMAARRLAKQQVLTRRLNAIETLGQTTVLCVDKTGTLTQNRMEVAALCVDHQTLEPQPLSPHSLPEPFLALLEYAVLASETQPQDPMEQAFHRLAKVQLARTDRLHPLWRLECEYELAPTLLAMSHVWRDGASEIDHVATKGAPEAIADLCHLPPDLRENMNKQAALLAERGLRVLGVARASHRSEQAFPAIQHEFEFEWLGLIGLADPLRPEVPAAIADCRKAGIRVIMITGDHPRTAQAVAQQAGIAHDKVITGDALAKMSPSDLAGTVSRVCVFARIKPQQKLALVEALKARGEVVAMTGDGVNDAPALKAAHIGIAMGQRGTDVAREAAALVLLHDDFSAILKAIAQGRLTFANLRQAMVYTMAVHVPIVGLALLPVLFGFPLILAPLHIAFLELIMDPACSIVFESQTGTTDLMSQPPRRSDEPLLSSRHVVLSLLQGAVVTLAAMGIYAWLLTTQVVGEAATLAFVVLVTANVVLILPTRQGNAGWGHLINGLTPVSMWVMAGTFVSLVAITAVPWLAKQFNFVALSATQELTALAAGLGMLLVFTANKWLIQKFPGPTSLKSP
jgi:Ca2+-transporting ATPase